jgi:hypothetical protein
MSRVAAMDESKGYFQFPLCLLAFGKDEKERLQYIVSYCLCQQAGRTDPKFPKVAWKASLNKAGSFLAVRIGSPESTINRWKEADSFARQWGSATAEMPWCE